MKLNLGCGKDIREGYLNVDYFDDSADFKWNLEEFPWPWDDNSVDEILMHDILEHFPYRKVDSVLYEVYRILSIGGKIDIQVPDFTHCALAAICREGEYLCNVCGTVMTSTKCSSCGADSIDIAQAALNRLFGGQDTTGNWHYTAFTQDVLFSKMKKIGFKDFSLVQKNQNGETYWQNWNFRLVATKTNDAWD